MPLGPILNNPELFSQAWVDGLRHVPESGMAGTITIFAPPSPTDEVWDPELGDYVGGSRTVLYTGKARVQPMRAAVDRAIPGNDTSVQLVLLSVPVDFTDVDLRPGKHQVEVTAAPLNPQLTKFQYVVHEVLDSTNPLEKTFMCRVNQEVVVTPSGG